MITYKERRDWVMREAALWDAECNGIMDAAIFDEPRKAYQSVTFQSRYERAFWDGKAALMAEQVEA